jgi:predicted O-linked N-acetylglucosamine transferase (SPINDLY family)
MSHASSVSRYSERLLLMPRTYQVNDYPGFYRNDVPPDFAVSRADHALPENRVILANFNQLYKIDPDTLSLWARVLHSCSTCVLWLLAFPYHAKDNMLKVNELLNFIHVAVRVSPRVSGVGCAQCVHVSGVSCHVF